MQENSALHDDEMGVAGVSSHLYANVTKYHAQIGANVDRETLQAALAAERARSANLEATVASLRDEALHLREALAVQLEHSQPLRLDRRPLPALAPFIQEEGAAASSY